jgi:uncharacterized protein
VKIAVVGSGVSGLVAAHRLHAAHEVTLFEGGDHVGGHTCTVDVTWRGARAAVDTGFIVFNERTYPGFTALLRELGVAAQPSTMSFSVHCERTGLEYNGTSLDTLFAQRTNLVRPSFWRMVRDILRFYREAPELLEGGDDETSLVDWLEQRRYSSEFIRNHVVPMAAAVWSARPDAMRTFPARYLVQFFHNHGFLTTSGRPQWLVVRGGSREYVRALAAPFQERIRLRTPITEVRRVGGDVQLTTKNGERERFERVILACHADQALRILADASEAEREVLSAFAYQANHTVLHTDEALLPARRRARASWNYRLPAGDSQLATMTYWMNELQGIRGPHDFLVTLNQTARIDPARVLWQRTWHHPIYTPAAVRAQARHAEIDGARGVHFCGAYWGYGFHEDGLQSALAVCRQLEAQVPA